MRLAVLFTCLFCIIVCVIATDTETRLSDTLFQYHRMLQVDGSYSQCATLPNRLHLVNLQAHQMTWRHLWNYLGILILGLETLNPSHVNVIQWKRDLDIIIARLRRAYLPGISDAYDYQVDYQMVIMVNEHLLKLLKPTENMLDFQYTTMDRFVSQRSYGSSQMFRSLFQFWEAPKAVIQLLTRSYLPYIYLLHGVHDANQVYEFNLLAIFYIPIHQCIVETAAFAELGDESDYEVVLTYVDSNLMD